MRFSFATKIGVAITSLSILVTGVTVVLTYNNTKEMVLDQMRNRLMDIGRAGAYIFTEQERADIIWLKQQVDARHVFDPDEKTRNFLLGKDGKLGTDDDEIVETLPKKDSVELMNDARFLRIVQALRKVREGSREKVRHLQNIPALHEIRKTAKDMPSMEYLYLLSEIPGQKPADFIMYLADADYLPVDDDGTGEPYEGNPTGTLTMPLTTEMHLGFSGSAVAEQEFSEDQWGDVVISGYVPILDQNDKVLAVMGIDYNAAGAANKLNNLFNMSIAVIIVAIFLSVFFAYGIAKILNKPIAILNKGAERVADGDYSVEVNVKTKDELGQLALTFNNMVDEIRNNTQNLTELNQAYERFVPKEFLKYLGKDDIKKLKLGDQIQREMAVLFSDIRSFTTLSEKMTPHDNFDFLNSYLQRVSPKIRNNNGFIDKFIGDAIMALFPDHVDNAMQASLDMQNAVTEYNIYRAKQGNVPIRIGIGVHTGMLMLGTIGEDLRMEGTVISDAVNLASRLEGLTKRFGALIMTSDHSLDLLHDKKDKYMTRYLGRVRVKGKKDATKVYEILNCEPKSLLELKIKTMEKFEEGIKLFNQGKFGDSGRLFSEVLAINKEDTAATVYYERCQRILTTAKK